MRSILLMVVSKPFFETLQRLGNQPRQVETKERRLIQEGIPTGQLKSGIGGKTTLDP